MSVIALAAVGFTMQFGITNMINLAYGEVMIASAFVAYYLNQARISVWIAMLGGAAFGAVFSFLINRFVYAPFQRKGTALLRYTRLGKAMRATAANPMLARNCGIPTNRVIDAVWLITGSLCGLAGVVAALDSDSFTIGS